jgi:hypothetical protein
MKLKGIQRKCNGEREAGKGKKERKLGVKRN